jgi:hypothetical protein
LAVTQSAGAYRPAAAKPSETRPVALALLSGGLDSTLAARVILEQGVNVIGINFSGAYCPAPRHGLSNAQKAAVKLGIELVTLPVDTEFIATVKHPKHGYGKNMNPCIDCHTLMIRKAWESGRTRGALFIVTGEVLGQRPMSQNRRALEMVARESGTEGRLVRPMSALLLEPTIPEQEGPLDRVRLLDIEGRSRQRQFRLAESYGIVDYPQPAGGCLLTETVFARRLREAFGHGEDSLETVELLRFGRHFRLPSGSRVIVGRDREENEELVRLVPSGSAVIDGTALPGPAGLLIPDRSEDRELAARLCAGFSDRRAESLVTVRVGDSEMVVAPASPEESSRLLIA